MKLTFNRKLNLFFIFFSVGMAVLGALTYKNAQQKFDHSQWVSHTYEVLNKSSELKSIAQDNETGSRGYIITGDSAFLEPFIASEKHIFMHLYELRQLTADNASQQVRIDSLHHLIQDRMAFSLKTIEVRNSKGFETAAGMVALRTGKNYMDNIRRMIGAIQQEEYRLLEQRKNATAESENAFMITFYSLLVAAFAVLLITILIIKRNLDYRHKLEQEIIKMNTQLAKKVKDKTKEVKLKEERYHFVLDNIREGTMIVSNDWVYLYANNYFLEHGKLPHAAMIGKKMGNDFFGAENTVIMDIFKHCMQERVARIEEIELIYPDGAIGYFKLSVQPIPEGLFILAMDIAERKKRERAREQYIDELQEVLFKISHEVRHPVSQILGLANLVNYQLPAKDFRKITDYMKQSARTLDDYTRGLTEFVTTIRTKSENHK